MSASIRFGVIYEAAGLSAWQVQCLEELLGLPGVECALAICSLDDAELRIGTGTGGRLFELYRKVWARPRALRQRDAGALLRDVPRLVTGDLDDETCEKIRSSGLDFLLHLGGPEPEGAVLEAPRHGTWSFHIGNPPGRRPVGFWEISDGEPVTEAALCRLVRPGAAVVLKHGAFRTAGYSYQRQVDEVHFGCTQ